jgi:hypothetical protein
VTHVIRRQAARGIVDTYPPQLGGKYPQCAGPLAPGACGAGRSCTGAVRGSWTVTTRFPGGNCPRISVPGQCLGPAGLVGFVRRPDGGAPMIVDRYFPHRGSSQAYKRPRCPSAHDRGNGATVTCVPRRASTPGATHHYQDHKPDDENTQPRAPAPVRSHPPTPRQPTADPPTEPHHPRRQPARPPPWRRPRRTEPRPPNQEPAPGQTRKTSTRPPGTQPPKTARKPRAAHPRPSSRPYLQVRPSQKRPHSRPSAHHRRPCTTLCSTESGDFLRASVVGSPACRHRS